MYKVYLDGNLMHFTGSEQLPLHAAKLSVELNRTGSFTFTIGTDNQYYGALHKKKSIVRVYDDNRRLYRGRVLDSKRDFYNDLHVTCEGELAFLKDSRQRPYTFEGSVADYLALLINNHNSQVEPEKQFRVGDCTVTDPNNLIVRADSGYPETWETIQKKLIEKLGGYIWTREEQDGVYIDYLQDFETINLQEINFGENLIDFEENVKGADIATAVIPLGAKIKDAEGNDTEERLTIADVNNGIDYVAEQAAVDEYGMIFATVVWDDVTVASNLLRKGREELQRHINLIQSIRLTAVDLHNVNADIRSFWVGNYTRICSQPHAFNELLLTRKIELDLLNPASGTLTLGDERKTFVDKSVELGSSLHGIVVENGKNGKDGQDAILLKIDSSRGTVFKNNAVSTVMTITIFKGQTRIENITDLRTEFGAAARLEWQWLRLGEEAYGIISASDPMLGNDGFMLTLTPEDVDTKVTFRCNLII